MPEHRYEVIMSNGDRGECDTIPAVLVAAETMWRDSERTSYVDSVELTGIHTKPLTAVARAHLFELEGVSLLSLRHPGGDLTTG